MGASSAIRSSSAHPRTREIFACLARAGQFKDAETAEHVERVSRTCSLIARRLGLTQRDASNLKQASAVHDIGKIGVPDAVLLKPSPLNAEERAMIELHSEIGHQILSGSRDPVMRLAAIVALTHHEWVDGCGYPGRLRGDAIPLPGRIAAVADVFDALTHDRVYRAAVGIDGALAILEAGRGTQFDKRVLDAFQAVLPRVLEIRRRFPNPPGRQPGIPYPDASAGYPVLARV
jgi:putative two-component system response regulator